MKAQASAHGQVFGARLELGIKLAVLALLLLVPALFGFSVWRESSYQALGQPVEQPIPFSHKHHVGDDGIDCRYCHTTVETSRHAGLPASSTCLGCHSQLYTDQAVLRPLHESARTGQPIGWRRVHTLPGYVYFNHGVHVSKGVGCSTCHGSVDRMPLMRQAAPLTMAWCLSCHQHPEEHLRPLSAVFDMGWTPPPDQDRDGRRLMAFYHIDKTPLTDCSRCHR